MYASSSLGKLTLAQERSHTAAKQTHTCTNLSPRLLKGDRGELCWACLMGCEHNACVGFLPLGYLQSGYRYRGHL